MDVVKPLKQIDHRALIHLKGAKHRLTAQQYRTLKGQVLAGDAEGAMKGLQKILLMVGSNAIKRGETRK